MSLRLTYVDRFATGHAFANVLTKHVAASKAQGLCKLRDRGLYRCGHLHDGSLSSVHFRHSVARTGLRLCQFLKCTTGQVTFRSSVHAIALLKHGHIPLHTLQITEEDLTLQHVWCEYAAWRLPVLVARLITFMYRTGCQWKIDGRLRYAAARSSLS
jgi:hypothetical protein